MSAYPIDAVLQKYRGLNEAGIVNFLTGKAKTFPDKEKWPEGWKNDANLAVIPSITDKQRSFFVLTKIDDMSHDAKMTLWRPQLHSTIFSGDLMTGELIDATYEGKRREVFDSIAKDPRMKALIDNFEWFDAKFGRLVFDGSSVTLNCVDIPEEVRLLRTTAAVIYKKYGVPDKSMDNIFHLTLARIRSLPESTTIKDRAKFVAAISTLAVEIAAKPIRVEFNRLWFGRNIQDVLEPPV